MPNPPPGYALAKSSAQQADDEAAAAARKAFVSRRSIEWREHAIGWRWLQDSYEGGNRYRNAIYGLDHRGLPVRNMIRHKREYPNPREQGTTNYQVAGLGQPASSPMLTGPFGPFPGALGSDAAALATDDPYEYRRARTPVPRFCFQAINLHLSKIFGREVARAFGPKAVASKSDAPGKRAKKPVRKAGNGPIGEFWKDTNGRGTSIDDWMQHMVGPLLLMCGSVDILFDHPENRSGAVVETLSTQKALGLDRCVASYILPDNMLWWQLDAAWRYTECLVREYQETETGETRELYRHWEADKSTLYDLDGNPISTFPHKFGRVPIVRLMGVPKFRLKNTGQPEYEELAELQREYYNRDSELVLSDSLQAHPLLMGPDDYCKADGEVAIGPDYLLPKKKNETGTSVTYEPFAYLEPPKGGAESIRTNKGDIREQVDRAACLTKPPGVSGTSGSTVAQSGVSKQMDQSSGNDLLTRIASQLQNAERLIAEYALLVQRDRAPTAAELDEVTVTYPSEFDLFSALDLSTVITNFQLIVGSAGELEQTEYEMLSRLVQLILPGMDDEKYELLNDELEAFMAQRVQQKVESAESGAALKAAQLEAITNPPAADPFKEPGNSDTAGGATPPTSTTTSGPNQGQAAGAVAN